jgi:hypothetical protein
MVSVQAAGGSPGLPGSSLRLTTAAKPQPTDIPVLSILLALVPAAILRFLILRRPLSRAPAVGTCSAIWFAGFVGLTLLGLRTSSAGSIMGSAAVISYFILRSDARPAGRRDMSVAAVPRSASSFERRLLISAAVVCVAVVVALALFLPRGSSRSGSGSTVLASPTTSGAAPVRGLATTESERDEGKVSGAQPSSHFITLALPYGVSLDAPRNWRVLDDETNRTIATSTQAALDLSGIDVEPGEDAVLFSANSMPPTTYAAVRVSAITPPVASPAEVRQLRPREVREIGTEMMDLMQLVGREQGWEILDHIGTSIETVSGYPVLVIRYRRTGPKGPVIDRRTML